MPDPTAPERLTEIRANDQLSRHLRGDDLNDDYATDAEIDRRDLLAALDAVLRHHEPVETANGKGVCPKCSRAAGVAVFAPCEEVRDIAAALTKEPTRG